MISKKDVKATYDKIASWMDQHRNRDLFEKPLLDKAIENLPGNRVLDMGCGTGEPIGEYLLMQGLSVLGIDNSEAMLKIARTRNPKFHCLLVDMRNFTNDEPFDLIVAWHSFFHLPNDDQPAMFKKFASLLQTNGKLLFTSGPSHGEVYSDNGGEMLYHASLSENEYRKLLEENGFEVLVYEAESPHYKGATVWLTKKVA